MTYKEIKDRLSKCETTLTAIKDGTYKEISSIDIKETTSRLKVLQESLRQKLADAVEFEDEKDAAEFAQDNPDTPVKVVDEMKPGDEEDLERQRFNRLSSKDQETIKKIYALIQREKDTQNETEETDLPVPVETEPESKDDLDIGHQDDEPNMLKATAYESATYAAKLYKKLHKYDQFDGEVDFPNWWQSKLILAKDYLSKAYHYLDSEEKQPAIDQLALEGKYKSDAQRKAIHAKKAEINEASNDEAIDELRHIVDQAVDLGGEAREVVRQFFPDELSRLDSYGAFDLVYSNNRYDVTLGRFVDRLEEEGYDGDLDELFGSASKLNYDDIIGPIVKKFVDLKKYVSKKEPDAMDDLQKVIRAFEIFDEKMSYGTHMELEEATVAKIQKAHGQVVTKMKELAKQYKAGDKSVVDQLKDLTAKKKELEKHLDTAVAGTNRNQELNERGNHYGRALISVIKDMASDFDGDEVGAAEEAMEFIGQEYEIDFEFGAGPSRQLEEVKGGKFVVRPCSAKNTPWAVWQTSPDGENDKRIKGFKTRPEAQKFADEKNAAK